MMGRLRLSSLQFKLMNIVEEGIVFYRPLVLRLHASVTANNEVDFGINELSGADPTGIKNLDGRSLAL